jgi:hypothetical protein
MNTESDQEVPLPRNNGEKTKRIDLGLATLSATAAPGATHTPEEIACFCDCTPALIASIEARALRKMRKKMAAQFNINHADTAELRRWLASHFRP